jgi:hypothetical protein
LSEVVDSRMHGIEMHRMLSEPYYTAWVAPFSEPVAESSSEVLATLAPGPLDCLAPSLATAEESEPRAGVSPGLTDPDVPVSAAAGCCASPTEILMGTTPGVSADSEDAVDPLFTTGAVGVAAACGSLRPSRRSGLPASVVVDETPA